MPNGVPGYLDWLVNQQYHRHLLRLAEGERLAKSSVPARVDDRDLINKIGAWIRDWRRSQAAQTVYQDQACLPCCPQTV